MMHNNLKIIYLGRLKLLFPKDITVIAIGFIAFLFQCQIQFKYEHETIIQSL